MKGITVGQIAKTLRCHERSARIYLSEVNTQIDRYADNLSELIDFSTIVALCRRYHNTLMGRRLATLLQTADH